MGDSVLSRATWLPEVDVAILRAAAASRGGRLEKSAAVLARLPEDLDLGEVAAYEALCELVQPWCSVLPLLEGYGNFGDPHEPGDWPAGARYTECRLSAAGAAAIAAEAGTGPPVPFGLVLGDVLRGGRCPAFAPAAVAKALHLAAEARYADAVGALGGPWFPGGCPLEPEERYDDLDPLETGEGFTVTIHAVLERHDHVPPYRPGPEVLTGGLCSNPEPHVCGPGPERAAIDIVALPPGVGAWSLIAAISRIARTTRSPLADVQDIAPSGRDEVRVRCLARPDTTLDALEAFLRAVPGVSVEVGLQLPRPAGELLQRWVDRHGAAAVHAGADVLADLAAPGN